LQRTDSLEDIFNAALDAILGALQCDRASILLFDDTDVMRFVAWRGLSDGYREATDGHSPWKPGEKEPEPIYFNDIGTAELSDSLGSVIKEEGIGSLAFIPLVANERLIGKFMTYFNAPHIFSEGELELSLTIARQLAFGVDRKRAEEALRRNEQMFSTLVDAAPFGVYFIDSEFRLRAINKGSEHVFSGIHPLIGRDFAEIIRIIWQEPFATEAIERFRQTLRTGESFISTPIIEQRANIEEIEAYDWQIHRITLSDGTYGVVCYFYDLSEQKRMEATVRASEELYRTIARSIPGGGVYIVDKEFRYIVAEGSVSEAFGVSREMLEGHTVSDVFPQEMSTRMEDRLRRNFAGETINYETEHDGRVYWTQQAPLLDSLGQAIVVTLDITERKRAETELVESERRFREMIDALPAAIYTTDAEGLLTHFNPAAAEFSGRVPELGTDRWCVTLKLYHPDGTPLPHDQCPMAIALKEGRVVRGAQAIAERPDGRRIWFEPYPTPLRDSTGRIVGGINMLVDITERKQAEEALRHLNLQLESQVQSRTAKLRAVNQSLREEIAE
ncbi:MAG: PAS domain S-box protein, partial [Anaerolineales bacterium]